MRASLGWPRLNPWLITALLVVAASLPLVLHDYYVLNLLVITFVFATVNEAWNLVMGVAGIWSFMQLAIFAIGGYTSAILAVHLGISPWFGLLAGGLVATAVGVLVGMLSFRVTGIYVALFTLAFSEAVRLGIGADEQQGITGGNFGLPHLPQFFDLSAGIAPSYWMALALLVLSSIVVYRIMYSPLGIAFQAIRDSTRYAISRGVNPFQYQLLVFAISSFLTGVAGAFYAHYLALMVPNVIELGQQMTLLSMIVVGGLGTFAGPLVGTAVLTFVTEILRGTEQFRLVALGVILLVIIVVSPGGLVELFSRGRTRFQQWLAEDDRPAASEAISEASETREEETQSATTTSS